MWGCLSHPTPLAAPLPRRSLRTSTRLPSRFLPSLSLHHPDAPAGCVHKSQMNPYPLIRLSPGRPPTSYSYLMPPPPTPTSHPYPMLLPHTPTPCFYLTSLPHASTSHPYPMLLPYTPTSCFYLTPLPYASTSHPPLTHLPQTYFLARSPLLTHSSVSPNATCTAILLQPGCPGPSWCLFLSSVQPGRRFRVMQANSCITL
jgi:hypothetical protein